MRFRKNVQKFTKNKQPDLRLQHIFRESITTSQSTFHFTVSTLDAIFVEVSHDNAKFQLHSPHGFGVQSVSIRPAVYEIRAAELGTSADKHLRQLLLPGAERPPGHTAYPVMSGAGGDMAVPVTVQLAASERVLVPHLKMKLWPALQSFGRVVQINRVTPVRHVSCLGDIHLGLTLLQPRQKPPCSSRMNSPFAKQAVLRETTAPDDLAYNMQLCHVTNKPLHKNMRLRKCSLLFLRL